MPTGPVTHRTTSVQQPFLARSERLNLGLAGTGSLAHRPCRAAHIGRPHVLAVPVVTPFARPVLPDFAVAALRLLVLDARVLARIGTGAARVLPARRSVDKSIWFMGAPPPMMESAMHCPYCQSPDVHRSKSKNARMKVVHLFGVYLRCHQCTRAFLRSRLSLVMWRLCNRRRSARSS